MKSFAIALVFFLACAHEAVAAVSTTDPGRIPPVSVATTTTIEPAERPTRLRGGGTAWRQAVADVYGPAYGGDRALVPTEMRDWTTVEVCPGDGVASSAMIAGTTVAVAALGDDLIYGFDQGSGLQIVAARVPSSTAPFTAPCPRRLL
ncbi:MAG: hypothetical protein ACRDWA_10060 [Acidimicrobiia bacterium]